MNIDWKEKSGEWFKKFNAAVRELKALKADPFKGKTLLEMIQIQREVNSLVTRLAERTPPAHTVPPWAVYATHSQSQGGMVFQDKPQYVDGLWQLSRASKSQAVSGWPHFDSERREDKRVFVIAR